VTKEAEEVVNIFSEKMINYELNFSKNKNRKVG